MNSQEILSKSIEQAIAGGWDMKTLVGQTWIAPDVATGYQFRTGNDFIFNHDFAKALWGEEKCPFQILNDKFEAFGVEHETYYWPKWKIMLQGMVLADDPIAYLEEHM